MDFVGDDKYAGDGGAVLQKLWGLAKWREIRGCPGRYVSSEKSIRSLAPKELLRRLLACDSGCGGGGGGFGSTKAATTHHVQEFQIPGKDRIAIACLDGGGGLLTYVKMERAASQFAQKSQHGPVPQVSAADQNQDPSLVFVHTLNTESGLLRKLEALGLGEAVLPQMMTRIAPTGVSQSCRPLSKSSARGVIFYAVLVVLGYLTAAEKNAAATVLVVWSKRLMRGRLQTARPGR
eukprot:INCI9691.1.p1 GENE.INCI9691.1~~INCI9691.1.p1  ORF type:complete len:235 (+),score=37.68 INCI9691.1:321-1025(+)